MKAKKKHTAREYLEYLKGLASMQERHELEASLEADSFAREAMEGLEELDPEQAEKDVLALHARLSKRLARRRRIRWYGIAASVASILIVGTIFLQIYDTDPVPETAQPELVLEEKLPEFPAEVAGEDAPTEEVQAEVVPELTRPEPLPDVQAATTREIESPREKKSEATEGDGSSGDAAGTSKSAAPIAGVPAEPAPESFQLAAPEKAEGKRGRRQNVESIMAGEAAVADEAVLNESMSSGMGMVSGVVLYSEDLQPLPGVSVMVKEAGTGVSADMLGRFSLPVRPDTLSTLLCSFVGMENGEFPAMAGEDLKLVLHPDISSMDEIVLVQGKSSDFNNLLYRAAVPEDGFRSYSKYIKKHLHYPESASGDRQVVILSFLLTAEGDLLDFFPVRSPGPEFTEEAIRLISDGPAWKPAENPAGPVDELVRIRIVFEP